MNNDLDLDDRRLDGSHAKTNRQEPVQVTVEPVEPVKLRHEHRERSEKKKQSEEALPEAWRPFVRDDLPMRGFRWVRLVVGLVVLLPVRVVLLACVVVLAYIVDRLLGVVLKPCLSKAAIVHVQRVLVAGAARMALLVIGVLWVERSGDVAARRRGKDEPCLIVCNHVSWLDILVVMAECKFPAFVAKAAVRDVPFVGYFCTSKGAVYANPKHHVDPLDRKGHKDRNQHHNGRNGERRALRTITEQIVEYQERYENDPNLARLALFPEGTTSNGKALLYFHRGAFVGGRPVRPVVVEYPYVNFSAAWESFFFIAHMCACMSQFCTRVKMRYLPVYRPSAEEVADPAVFARNVRQVMADALDVPVCDSKYQDKKAYHQWFLRANNLDYDSSYHSLFSLCCFGDLRVWSNQQ